MGFLTSKQDKRRAHDAANRKRVDPGLHAATVGGRCLGCRRKVAKNLNLCKNPACSRAVAAAMED
ncbi:hypothetical protein ACFXPA_44155 [Amycolatopsis sp. NPDC059090]|uniref:hypothetical protein n=1 Tax=unclassified Amycolatopsis TaxID=2618356 RepID=UPI003672D627